MGLDAVGLRKTVSGVSTSVSVGKAARAVASAFWIGVLAGAVAVCLAAIFLQVLAVGPFQPFRLIVAHPSSISK